jgi:hypothetical protein
MVLTVSIDIDGTISEYPKYWLMYLESKTGIEFETTTNARIVIGDQLYEELKDKWRKGPEKYNVPIFKEAIELSKSIYLSGGIIFMNTQRPLSRYPNMRAMTMTWLENNDFCFEDVQEKTALNLKKQGASIHIDNEISEALRIAKIDTINAVILVDETSTNRLEMPHEKITYVMRKQLNQEITRFLTLL